MADPIRWGVVVPSNRPDRLRGFVEQWEPLFERHRIGLFLAKDHEPWPGIPEWIPKRTDAIRSHAIAEAVRAGCTHILSLDDDVVPAQGEGADGVVDPFAAYAETFERGAPVSQWFSIGALTDTGLQMRGFPHGETDPRPVAVQYGGWVGVPDLDGLTQRAAPRADASFAPVVVPVPGGAAVTCCAMNFAFPAWFAVCAWQLPVVDGRYDRWCDIWSGMVQKRVADACGLAVVVNGRAQVHHTRASDVEANIRKEAPGYRVHDGLWEALDVVRAGTCDHVTAWRVIIGSLARHVEATGDKAWADRLFADSEKWAALFS